MTCKTCKWCVQWDEQNNQKEGELRKVYICNKRSSTVFPMLLVGEILEYDEHTVETFANSCQNYKLD